MMNEQTIKARQAEMSYRIVKLLKPGQVAEQDGVKVTFDGRFYSVSTGKGKRAKQMTSLDAEHAATIFAFGF